MLACSMTDQQDLFARQTNGTSQYHNADTRCNYTWFIPYHQTRLDKIRHLATITRQCLNCQKRAGVSGEAKGLGVRAVLFKQFGWG